MDIFKAYIKSFTLLGLKFNARKTVMKLAYVQLFSLLSTSLLLGDDCLDSRITDLEEKMQEIRDCTMFGRAGAQFSCAKPPLNCWGEFYLTGDALYWKMFEGGTEFVYTDVNNNITVAGNTLIGGKAVKVDFDWHWGYRVGAAFVFPSNCWGLYLTYTSLKNKGKNEATQSPGGILIPLYLSYTPTQNSAAQSQWKIDFSTLDLELGRSFFVSSYLNLRIRVGLKGADIDQQVKAHYLDLVDTIETSLKITNDFIGAGLSAGFDSQWFVYRQFSLFLDATAAMLFGRFHLRYIEDSQFEFLSALANVNDHFRPVVPTTQMMIGLGWETCLGSHYYLGIKAGYETQYWWRQNQIPHNEGTIRFPYGKRVAADLSMHGLFLKAEFDF